MFIPNVIPPFEDELLYSYILRLADANGFDDVPLFLWFYVNDRMGLKNPTIKYNSEEPLNGLVKYLHPILNPDGTETDFLTFYLDHSMARFYHGYIHEYVRRHVLNSQFRIIGENQNISTRYGRRNRPPLNFCPECMKKDIEQTRTFYIHRIHQNAYAHLCPIHNCRLLCYTGPPGQELKDDSFLEETQIEECRYSQLYTKMCFEMFDINRNLDRTFEYYEKNFWNLQIFRNRSINIMRFIEYLEEKWSKPLQRQFQRRSTTSGIRNILMLLYIYENEGRDLDEVLNKKDSEIPVIKRRIEVVTAQ